MTLLDLDKDLCFLSSVPELIISKERLTFVVFDNVVAGIAFESIIYIDDMAQRLFEGV